MQINKRTSLIAFIWSAIERFSVQGFQLILTFVMARLLTPKDYGVVAMLTIFIAIANSIIDSGFSNALIHKKDRNQKDYSTVFYINIALGLLMTICLFFSSSLIAKFYSMPLLNSVTKITSLNLLIISLSIVQRTKLTINLDFKSQAKVSVIAIIFSGILGICLAYNGFGVWSLVFQTLLNNVLITTLLWIYGRWKPSLIFSIESFKKLFGFGSKLLITGLYGPIFDNLSSLCIGKVYNSASLGYYNRAQSIAMFPSSNITGILNRVSFPILSSVQDSPYELLHKYKILIRQSAFIVFPLMSILFCTSNFIIIVLLGEKWSSAVPLLKIMCIALMLYPINAYNINIFLVKGKTNLHLKLDLLKKLIALGILLYCLHFSIIAICIGQIITSFISYIITAHFSGRLISYSTLEQVKDLCPVLMCCLLVMVEGECINNLFDNITVGFIANVIFLPTSYLILSYIFNRDDLMYSLNTIKNGFKKKN